MVTVVIVVIVMVMFIAIVMILVVIVIVMVTVIATVKPRRTNGYRYELVTLDLAGPMRQGRSGNARFSQDNRGTQDFRRTN